MIDRKKVHKANIPSFLRATVRGEARENTNKSDFLEPCKLTFYTLLQLIQVMKSEIMRFDRQPVSDDGSLD